jgi:stage II sporulation protein D
MMKRFMAALIFVLIIVSPSISGGEPGRIRVLVLDRNFRNQPPEGEELTMVERTNGDLIIGDTTYSGDIEVWRGANGLYLVNEIPLEVYVEGVVKAESGSNWALEALKAQAVVVRTYLYHQMRRNAGKKYDITSSVLHQLYKGLNKDSLVKTAVRETEWEVLTYEGIPIVAYYHSTCGGKTELPEAVFGRKYPYLKSVTTSCALSPLSMWVRRIPLREVEKATGAKGIAEIIIASYTPTGRVGVMDIHANPETVSVEAKDLRKMLGWSRLPSTDFSLAIEDDTLVLEGKGYGHGVGLCQWSALEMALEGRDYKEILSFFYPGAALELHETERF